MPKEQQFTKKQDEDERAPDDLDEGDEDGEDEPRDRPATVVVPLVPDNYEKGHNESEDSSEPTEKEKREWYEKNQEDPRTTTYEQY